MRTMHCTSAVIYRRPPDDRSLLATYGRTDVEVTDESGMTITTGVWDFLILAGDLGLVPRPGDQIVTDGRTYEVMRLGGDGCWRWSDPYRTTYRIHTKEIGAEG
jgi:hypothetical protein